MSTKDKRTIRAKKKAKQQRMNKHKRCVNSFVLTSKGIECREKLHVLNTQPLSNIPLPEMGTYLGNDGVFITVSLVSKRKEDGGFTVARDDGSLFTEKEWAIESLIYGYQYVG
ncbi:hypothetical protein C9J12_27320 [Photobacterium frigidiphilum]|uniref:Uncharacterized protein n=1 Tax=Photobacterium frigidiphilum TaxID=264736 RepID=A0A2T3J6Z2_9GAMM|nr:hypothetical protein [Photobacterium frigidiphilum]PSU44264.1 hypothetical protein C9J12_27320 [Photobacterium frigidiphilum]